MTMIRVNIHEMKARFSKYLDAALAGQRVVVCRRNVPLAELRALPEERTEERPLGLQRGKVPVPDSFFEPLPEDLLDAFDGHRE